MTGLTSDAPRPEDDGRILTFGLFLEAHARLVAELDGELQRECGLSLRWFEVLIRLARSPDDSLTAGELARELALSSGGATRFIDRIEEAGFVERESDPADRRVVRIHLTPAGRRRLSDALPHHLDGLERHLLEPAGPDRLDTFEAVARSIRDHVDHARATTGSRPRTTTVRSTRRS